MTTSRHLAKGIAVGLGALAIAAALGNRAGIVAIPLDRPDSPMFWNLARVAGLTAYLALTAVVALGMLVSTGALDRWIARARCLDLHRFLSSVMLALVATHGLAFIGDRVASFDVLDVLVPFLAPYRPVAVGIGVLATYLLLVVHGSATLRARLGQRAFHALHALSFPAFWLITAHGILAGSDAHRAGMRAVYLVCSGLVLALTLVRLGELALPRGGRPGERTRGSVDG
jgi:predicted ferric reductase